MFTDTTLCCPMAAGASLPSSLFPHVVLPKDEISSIKALSKLGLATPLSAHPRPSQTRASTYHPVLHASPEPQALFASQHEPHRTPQVWPLAPPQLPSGVVPTSHVRLPLPGAGKWLSGSVQFPDSQLPLPQKLAPVPQTPAKLQQSPQRPPHSRLLFLGPHLPSMA
jgi:hypothetical protein